MRFESDDGEVMCKESDNGEPDDREVTCRGDVLRI